MTPASRNRSSQLRLCLPLPLLVDRLADHRFPRLDVDCRSALEKPTASMSVASTSPARPSAVPTGPGPGASGGPSGSSSSRTSDLFPPPSSGPAFGDDESVPPDSGDGPAGDDTADDVSAGDDSRSDGPAGVGSASGGSGGIDRDEGGGGGGEGSSAVASGRESPSDVASGAAEGADDRLRLRGALWAPPRRRSRRAMWRNATNRRPSDGVALMTAVKADQAS
jgi:hypothetical protein